MGEAALPTSSVAPSYPPPQQISPHLILQPPLSRRGKGPGLILVLDHYALIEASEQHLDPPPLQKWAEEGFAVAQVLVPGKVEDGGEFPLDRALEALKSCEGCIFGKGVGVVSYLSRIPFYVEEAAIQHPEVLAVVSYGGRQLSTLHEADTALPPQLVHASGPEVKRRESVPLNPDPEPSSSPPSKTRPAGLVKTFRYEDAAKDANWVLPSDPAYSKRNAGVAHTRSVAFLKPFLNGPYFDLEAVWDEHCLYEFGERAVEKTMATMVAQPYVNHIPTMTGGIGKERLTAFYTHHFIFSNPDDAALSLVSRTVGTDRVIDEFVFSLTHDKEVPWLLPGIPPTGRKLEIPFTSVVAMRGDRLCHEHISWDQGTALTQLGLLPEYVPFRHAIDGKEAGEGKRYEVKLPVAGAETGRKLVDEGSEESNLLMGKSWRVVDDV
ncbi:Carboxymethylenebutenolidase [Ascochyta rabiei]|uniref:Carboxymethylenebutenolidase n=1 Tax=Didymella rabiei TaxID=5454 RepID=UPI002209A3E2|nr:Carboxymethylenebutenolidase [Ascochyta rabiei]UPX11820.1 Carboxymethylenebutenolidase [Ascochyta rabiei]